MTLILTLVAALVVTFVRFAYPVIGLRYRLGMLSLMYWGAALMWSVDGMAALAAGEPFVELGDRAIMADDALLGACVVLLGLVVWAGYLTYTRRRTTICT